MRTESGSHRLAPLFGLGLWAFAGFMFGQPTTPTVTPTRVRTPTNTPTSSIPVDVSIVKTVSGTVTQGSLITYDLQIHNFGPGVMPGATVFDVLPPEVAYVSCSVNPPPFGSNCNGGPGSFTAIVNPLAIGGSATVTIVVRVVAASGTITNFARVTFGGFDPDLSNNTSTISTVISGPLTPTPTPTFPATATPTPIGGGAAGSSIPMLSSTARFVLLFALLAAGWLVASRRT